MITLFLMSLAAAFLMILAIPVVCFALALEACTTSAARQPAGSPAPRMLVAGRAELG